MSREGNAEAIAFLARLLAGISLDFSFSGIKTSVLALCQGMQW